ncbi:hypothetical protein ACL03H_13740 [Saccharopolyspora sp. MS10]|uniref:hypothetical protein n=1 Tax=Saccharopolyspora sp. MS10 TaxID=3385973 RepID=UPI0039A39694
MTTGISILIMLAGMLVPVLAAAPFYIADRRREAAAAQADAEAEQPVAEIHVLHPEAPSRQLPEEGRAAA